MTFPQIDPRYSDISSLISLVSSTSVDGTYTDPIQCGVLNSLANNQQTLIDASSLMLFPYFINFPQSLTYPNSNFVSTGLQTTGGVKRSIQDFNSNSLIGSTYSIDVDSNESKKSKIEPNTNTEPSKVLHIRNIASRAQESDLSLLAVPFGKIKSMVYAKKTNQALLELEDSTEATRMFDYYTRYPPCFNGREMIIQYSKHISLELKLKNNNIDASVEAANKMIEKHRMIVEEWQAEKTPERRILRVVIENLKNCNINHLVIFKVFQRFGKVLRIIIFTKNMQCQCLVELDNSISAHVALLHLNGQDLFNDCCRLKIEFSKNSDSLQIQRQNDKCRDYTISPLSEDEAFSLQFLDWQAKSLPTSPTQQFPLISNFSIIPPQIQKPLYNDFMGSNNIIFTVLPNTLKTNIQTAPVTIPDSLLTPDCAINLLQQDSNTKPLSSSISVDSFIILVTNINCEKVNCDSLFTLFGVYGDVSKVCISTSSTGNALVYMSSSNQADLACRHLNSVPLFGMIISTYLISNEMVSQTIFNTELNSNLDIKSFINTPLHRFKKPNSKNHFNIYPPSPVLHLSNIPLSFNEEDLVSLFRNQGFQCCSLKLFQKDKKMALAKMSSLEDAISALIMLHNWKLTDSSHLRVSFSKALI